MEFDGRVDKIRSMLTPLKIKTSITKRKDVYFLTFDTKHPELLLPAWSSLYFLVLPIVKHEFPEAILAGTTSTRVKYRLGSLFEFLAKNNV